MTAPNGPGADASSWGSVVVLYYPDPIASACLTAARAQSDVVFVVDNTPDGSSLEWPADVVVLHRGSNIGLGRAYNLAAEESARRGLTHLILLDQDTVLTTDYRAVISAALARWHDVQQIACVGPLFTNWRHSVQNDQKAGGLPVATDMVVSSGSLIPLSAWRSVGGFEESLFIDYVDVEYCLRARKRGYVVLQVQKVLMQHGMGMPGTNVVAGFRRASSNYPPLRHYYLNRNLILTARRTGGPGWFLMQVWRRTKTNLLTLALEEGRFAKASAMWRGCLDGIRGRGGPAPDGLG